MLFIEKTHGSGTTFLILDGVRVVMFKVIIDIQEECFSVFSQQTVVV